MILDKDRAQGGISKIERHIKEGVFGNYWHHYLEGFSEFEVMLAFTQPPMR
jgi:hypothetical protein